MESMTNERVSILVNGCALEAPAGSTVAAALLHAGIPCRISVHGQLRAPLCGMGICFECIAAIDGVPLCRTCLVFCRNGMEIVTE
jgi:sarcosine oxidase subunit alpha